jgi:hypothetical protein
MKGNEEDGEKENMRSGEVGRERHDSWNYKKGEREAQRERKKM